MSAAILCRDRQNVGACRRLYVADQAIHFHPEVLITHPIRPPECGPQRHTRVVDRR